MNNDIAECVRKTGMSKSKVARAIGVSPGAITHWATGRNRPNLKNLARLAALAGVPVETLIAKYIATQTEQGEKAAAP